VALEQNRVLLERGILSQADQNLLYIDEVNLLDRMIIDAILDAAAQGQYTVRRGPTAATYRSRLTLVGSMNPEEGLLRPQIQDRFGLRVLVRGAEDLDERMEIYRRAVAYKNKPYKFVSDWMAETELAKLEVMEARKRLPKVTMGKEVERVGLRWIQELKIDSHRAEMTLFEAGRALAAADSRLEVTLADLQVVAPMALRQRQTDTASDYFKVQEKEEQGIKTVISGDSTKKRGVKKSSKASVAKNGRSQENKLALNSTSQAAGDQIKT
jgi:magnesium chelatase subunit I